MEKEVVPYQPSLDLKELGFDEPCLFAYNQDDSNKLMTAPQLSSYQINTGKNSDVGKINKVTAPTFSQAFRWFRDKHFIDISIQRLPIIDKGWLYYSSIDYHPKYKDIDDYDDNGGEYYKTYEEAEIECLNKLIEIVKK